jgi:Tol biopolymer transport system component
MTHMRRLTWSVLAAVLLAGGVGAGLGVGLTRDRDHRHAPGQGALTFTRLVRGQQSDHESVWVAAADGSHTREVTANGFGGALSPDGRWLTFEREQAQPEPNFWLLFLVDLVTGKTRPLGETTGDERWASVGARLTVSQPQGFFLIDAASRKRTRLVSEPVSSSDFTPDGRSIVLARGSLVDRGPGRSDLFLLRLSGHALVRLTHDGHSRSPLASRTGIAYVRFKNRYGAPEVWQMRKDGSSKRLVARCCESKWHRTHAGATLGFETVALSADGQRLLACQDSEPACYPVAIDLAGGRRYAFPETTKLGTRQESPTALDLTPDGRTALVLIRPFDDEPGPRLLYSLPYTGGKARLLARGAVFGRWRS